MSLAGGRRNLQVERQHRHAAVSGNSSQLDFVSHPSKLDVRIVAMSFGICESGRLVPPTVPFCLLLIHELLEIGAYTGQPSIFFPKLVLITSHFGSAKRGQSLTR